MEGEMDIFSSSASSKFMERGEAREGCCRGQTMKSKVVF